MAVPFIRVYYTPPEGGEQDITELINASQSRGLDLKSGVVSFSVSNSAWRFKTGGATDFVEDGLVEVYADYSPITKAPSQLLLSGQIRKIEPRMNESGSQMRITVADRTILLLSQLWSDTYDSKTAPQIIKQLVENVSQLGTGGRPITTTNVATAATVAPSFTTINTYSKVFKPVVEVLRELSQPEFTGEDRAYQFYVDKDNDLHWFYPSQTTSVSIVEGTDEIYELSFSRNADSVINMVIYNAGQDLNGNGILYYSRDKTSKTGNLRMKYVPMIDIAKRLKNLEVNAGNLVQSSSGTIPHQGLLYTPDTYSFTTSWEDSVASDSEYNSSFRTKAKEDAEAASQEIIRRFGQLLWTGSVELKGTNSFTAGDLVNVTSYTAGLSGQKLRVHDVRHSFSKTGWRTSLDLKEDEASVLGD